jgi:TM2 domain-containing membrane protein YozV
VTNSLSNNPPPMCGSCGAYLQPPNTTCQVCGVSQWPQGAATATQSPPTPTPWPAPVHPQGPGDQGLAAGHPPGAPMGNPTMYNMGQHGGMPSMPVQVVVNTQATSNVAVGGAVGGKSTGIAFLLSFLWLGAGNLYVGQTALGVVLMLVNVLLWMLNLTLIGWIVSFPVWVILLIVSVVVASKGVAEQNPQIRAGG